MGSEMCIRDRFKTNGSTHHQGIANELATIDLLNQHRVFAETVTHLGGTKHKADAMAGDKGISIKHKAGLKNGSFDWVNTSRTDDLLDPERFAEFFAFMRTVRTWDTDKRQSVVEDVRQVFAEICDAALNAITSETLTDWIKNELICANEGMAMAITDTKAGVCYVLEHDAIRAAQLLADGYVAELEPGRGNTSRKVVLRFDHHVVETGLRLRVTSNNGIKAFMGLSKANRNSQVVLKLQQDRVQNLVDTAADVRLITM